jgi:hypothetical protein
MGRGGLIAAFEQPSSGADERSVGLHTMHLERLFLLR